MYISDNNPSKIEVLQKGSVHSALMIEQISSLISNSPSGTLYSFQNELLIDLAEPQTFDLPFINLIHFFGKPLNEVKLKYQFPSSYIANFPFATIINGQYVIITQERKLLAESYTSEEKLMTSGLFLPKNMKVRIENAEENLKIVLYKNKPPRHFDENALIIPSFWHFNYHHWLIECLPRISRIIDFPFEKINVIVPDKLLSFQEQSLELLEVQPDSRISLQDNITRIKNLIFSSIGVFHPQDINWLRNKFIQQNDDHSSDQKIYISREDAENRKVTNEKEVIGLLSSLGFKHYILSNLTFKEQIQLFQSASIIVGPHGSGLSNIIFSDENSTLIEFIPNDKVNVVFWLLANIRNINYTFLSGELVNQNRDFNIDLLQLRKLIEKVLDQHAK